MPTYWRTAGRDDPGFDPTVDAKVEAFLVELDRLCRRHGIAIDCEAEKRDEPNEVGLAFF
jgi:hypothetical protein